MSKDKKLSVLIDTSFLITLFSKDRANHIAAKKYYKYFLSNSIKMYLSVIVISEYQQMQPVADIIASGNFLTLPYNYDDALLTAEVAYNLGGQTRRGDGIPKYKDDLKLMAQAKNAKIDFIITEDESTLARYCDKLSKAGMFSVKTIILKNGFDLGILNGGQDSLIDLDE